MAELDVVISHHRSSRTFFTSAPIPSACCTQELKLPFAAYLEAVERCERGGVMLGGAMIATKRAVRNMSIPPKTTMNIDQYSRIILGPWKCSELKRCLVLFMYFITFHSLFIPPMSHFSRKVKPPCPTTSARRGVAQGPPGADS